MGLGEIAASIILPIIFIITFAIYSLFYLNKYVLKSKTIGQVAKYLINKWNSFGESNIFILVILASPFIVLAIAIFYSIYMKFGLTIILVVVITIVVIGVFRLYHYRKDKSKPD